MEVKFKADAVSECAWLSQIHTHWSIFLFFSPPGWGCRRCERRTHTHTHRESSGVSDTRWRDVLKAVQYRAAAALAQILMGVNSLEASPRTSERLWLQRPRSPQPTRSARGPPSHCSEKARLSSAEGPRCAIGGDLLLFLFAGLCFFSPSRWK